MGENGRKMSHDDQPDGRKMSLDVKGRKTSQESNGRRAPTDLQGRKMSENGRKMSQELNGGRKMSQEMSSGRKMSQELNGMEGTEVMAVLNVPASEIIFFVNKIIFCK